MALLLSVLGENLWRQLAEVFYRRNAIPVTKSQVPKHWINDKDKNIHSWSTSGRLREGVCQHFNTRKLVPRKWQNQTRCSRWRQTSLLMLPPRELDEINATYWFWPIPAYYAYQKLKTWRHPLFQRYIMYHTAIWWGPNHVHGYHTQNILCNLDVRLLRYTSEQRDRQMNTQTRRSEYFHAEVQ